MSNGVKPSMIAASIAGAVLVIAAIVYFTSAPKNTARPVAGTGMTVQKLVLKAQKDPNSLTPLEREYYSKLPPATIESIKKQPVQAPPPPN